MYPSYKKMILVDPDFNNTRRNECKSRPEIESLLSASAPMSTSTVNNALQLLNDIKNSITWNDNLEVVIRNILVPNSNIVQLLLYATNQSTTKHPVPVELKKFSEFLGQNYKKSL